MDNWMGLFVVIGVLLALAVLSMLSSGYRERQLIKTGVLPEPGKTTDEDIERLLNNGYKVWAIKRYRQLHKVSLKDAKEKLGL